VIVMGRTASRVSEADALSYVAGYATGNDFTARDLQNGRGGQWMIGKAIDQFAPIGPHLVTAQIDRQPRSSSRERPDPPSSTRPTSSPTRGG
jgi:2-keto-4-pentenoate hydratase/2-oxohepta-3-ene-1,7-dioic acid hydratase in catechol pathway